MPREAERRFGDLGEIVEFAAGDMILEPGPLKEVYFLETGFASLIDPRSGIEFALVTPDGIAGHPAVLGMSHMSAAVQATAAVRALRVSVDDLEGMMEDPRVRSVLLEAVSELIDHLLSAVVSSSGTVKQRLARRLLLAAETQGDEIRVTHEQVARWLMVRRPGVTVALHELEGEGLIRNTRGIVRIRDPEGLQALARVSRRNSVCATPGIGPEAAFFAPAARLRNPAQWRGRSAG